MKPARITNVCQVLYWAACVPVLALVFVPMNRQAQSATITWGTAQNIVGDSDVITTGGFIQAWNFGSLTPSVAGTAVNTTVNGVLFSAAGVVSTGTDSVSFTRTGTVGTPTVSLTTSPATQTIYGWNNGVAGTSTPFTGLSSSYQSLLQTVSFAQNATNSMSVTFSDLIIGRPYMIQVWVNESRSNGAGVQNRTGTIDGVAVDYNTTNANGGLGQWLSGTFTADATTQSFVTAGVGGATPAGYINAVQLRAVPEPSGIVIAGIGVAAFFFARSVRARRRLTASAEAAA